MADIKDEPYTVAEAKDLDDFDGGPDWKGTVLASESRIVATAEALEEKTRRLKALSNSILDSKVVVLGDRYLIDMANLELAEMETLP